MRVSVRQLVKRSSLLSSLVWSARRMREMWLGGFITNHELANQLATVAPNSRGSPRKIADLTILSAQTFPLICRLLALLLRPPAEVRLIESVGTTDSSNRAAAELGQLLTNTAAIKLHVTITIFYTAQF
jgi:hypothetical protein